ncbi:MAG TPA: hypothetical protein VGE21_08940 [Flavobacteriales bacterium]
MAAIYPLYRRLRNGASLYRIEAEDRFTELQRVGAGWLVHVVVADRYPERVRLSELILASDHGVEPATEAEFQAAWAVRRSPF